MTELTAGRVEIVLVVGELLVVWRGGAPTVRLNGKSRQTYLEHYYSWSDRLPLSETAGTTFAEWMENSHGPKLYAVHPQGFLVFLRPTVIRQFDEYAEADPYSVAENIDSSFHRQRIQVTIDLLRQAIDRENESARILDVACGEGHITAAIHEQFPKAAIFAFDASLSAICRACRMYPEIEFAVADAYELPYPPEHFDCIVCNNIWEHVPDPLRLLAGVKRSLKQNGALIVSTPSRYRLENLLRVLCGKPVVFNSQRHVTEYSVGQVIEQMRWGGFKAETVAGSVICPAKFGIRTFGRFFIAAPVLAALMRLTRSHHKLGSTAFYLCRSEE